MRPAREVCGSLGALTTLRWVFWPAWIGNARTETSGDVQITAEGHPKNLIVSQFEYPQSGCLENDVFRFCRARAVVSDAP